MITIREYIEGKADLKISAYGTSDGANKGWDSRGRGRAKKNFEPPSSTSKLEPHKYKGLGNTICQTCGNTLNHPIHQGQKEESVFDYHQRKIAEADAKMPEAIRNVMSPPRK